MASLLDIIFPTQCVACDRYTERGELICAPCLDRIPIRGTLACAECGARLPTGKRVCHRDTPYVLGAAAAYDSVPVRKLIHYLKFDCLETAARPLGELLIRFEARLAFPLASFTVIPVPLGRARERKRGFNQSERIAERFASHVGLPIDARALLRIRETKPQSELRGLAARRANVANSFRVRSPELVAKKNILLIDDVTTTGVTLHEAASTLKTSGARRVVAFAVAKA